MSSAVMVTDAEPLPQMYEDWEPQVAEGCVQLDTKLLEIQQQLLPLLQMQHSELNKLTNLEKVRLHVSIAYVICRLWKAALYAKGVNCTDHKVHKEEERVRSYIAKIRSVTLEEKRKAQINKGAADRLLRHILGGTRGDDEDTGGAVDAEYDYAKEKKMQQQEKTKTKTKKSNTTTTTTTTAPEVESSSTTAMAMDSTTTGGETTTTTPTTTGGDTTTTELSSDGTKLKHKKRKKRKTNIVEEHTP
eukprot:TRINITY_DN59894_c0_g1_i1.p1 TRINITY_DN59894_c0_g1~~TRINITY_DN59894_c0_g1_i1.p1  ORF type:complete len:259 (-),score=44.03 TRINITY_DN59894_c0_g1_i1:78-815(-)